MNVNFADQIWNVLKVGILLSIVIGSFLIARSSFILFHPEIALAITFDLTITLPIAYWFFIRKTKISKLSVFGVFTLGIIIASFVLPTDNRQFLNYLKFFALPVFELGILSCAGFIVYKSSKTYKLLKENRADFLENLRKTLLNEFSSEMMVNAVTFEIAAFYYAFIGWKTKRGENFFTYHKKNGATALVLVLAFIIAVETFVVHLLIVQWNAAIAWILTAFSLYFLFQIYAHGKAIFLRPIEITDDKIFINSGLLGDTEIDLENIKSIDFVAPPIELEKDAVKLSPLGEFIQSNLKISLREEVVLNGLYGRKKNFKTIFLNIDERETFRTRILEKIEKK